jgi:uncharacterized protein YndB with AHSA1/START domain
VIVNPAESASFTVAFSVDRTPDEVFRAINNVRGWWSEDIDGRAEQASDVFNYRYQDVHHRCRIKVIKLVPGEKIAWRVLDNYFDFTQDEAEWKDTEIHFELIARSGETEIRFTHVGLVPERECFEVCSNSWRFYLYTSLRALIRTGHGLPNRKDQAISTDPGSHRLNAWRNDEHDHRR